MNRINRILRHKKAGKKQHVVHIVLRAADYSNKCVSSCYTGCKFGKTKSETWAVALSVNISTLGEIFSESCEWVILKNPKITCVKIKTRSLLTQLFTSDVVFIRRTPFNISQE